MTAAKKPGKTPIPKAKAGKKPPAKPIIWTVEEVRLMALHHRELLTTDMPRRRFDMLLEGQKLLPANRRRSYNSLYVSTIAQPHSMKAVLNRCPPPTEEEIEAFTKEQERKKKTVNRPEHLVRWVASHFNQLAHDPKVKPLIEDPERPPPNVKLVDAVMRAQHKHFPRAQWRKRGSVHASCFGPPGLLNQLRAGLAMPAPRVEPEQPEPASVTPNMIEQAVQTVAQNAVLPEPPTPATTLAEHFAQIAMLLLPRIEEMGTRMLTNAFRAAQAPREPREQEPASSEPKSPFDINMLKDSVRETIIEILGAPAPAPEETPTEQAKPPPETSVNGKRRVDVVGLLGAQEQVVQKICGEHWALRFIRADAIERTPVTAPHAIMLTKFVQHAAQDHIRKSGATLVYANGGAKSVVQRLNQLAAAL